MACVPSLPMRDRARAMRHARYVGPAGTGRFCVFVWFGLVRVGLEHAVQRRVPAPRDPVLISEIKKKNQYLCRGCTWGVVES